MEKDNFKIKDGSRIAVIGGGPAGSFFALYLLHYCQEKGIQPEITIYQEHNFDKPGPGSCKGCAGILSMSLSRNLNEIGLTIPKEVIQGEVDHYAVHSPYTSIRLSNPEKGRHIISVYRGIGPRVSQYSGIKSFDLWLLSEVGNRGAGIKYRRITEIDLNKQAKVKVEDDWLGFDLVVLASGINSKPVNISGLDYIPPETKIMAQDELYSSTYRTESGMENTAHAFLIPHSGLVFGTLVPKGPFITVSVLSSGHNVSVKEFLNYKLVKEILPEHYERACGCRPRTSIGPAQNYLYNRFVAVGDAAVTRLYKDGINSSLLTARQAAYTAVYHGVSLQDFKNYYEPFCNAIKSDNAWGRFLFSINDRVKNSRTFLLTQHRLIGDEQQHTVGTRTFTRAAWGMFTGSYNYKQIARMIYSPRSLLKLSATLLGESVKVMLHRKTGRYPKLYIGGKKILILGSGFGGTYVLRHLVPALNKNENVDTTMVSNENFFLFSPLLHEVAMGRIETRHVAYPIRRLNWRDRFTFIQTDVEKIDLAGKKVITGAGTLDYDYLVLALGSISDMSGLDNKEKNKNIFTLKTLYDTRLIKNHIIGLFEQASIEADAERQRQLLTFVVSGAGYIGVQLVTELRDLIYRSLIRYYKTIDISSIRILLIEKKPKIISGLHTKLGAYAFRQLQRMGVEIRLNSRITGLGENAIEINGSETVPTSTIVWLSGAVANPKIAELDTAKDNIGRVIVNEYMELPGLPGVYALGDCAHFEDRKSGQPIPRRAHIAVRQAKVVARNILAEIRGRDKNPYYYSRPPDLVSLGVSRAMFRLRGLRLYGFAARVIWLGAYSLLITGGYNRIRIIIDWLLAVIFGRDTAYIKTEIDKSDKR